MLLKRIGAAAAVAILARASLPAAAEDAAPAGERALACVNRTSGAAWQIVIDYDKRTVDANPARISESAISWHDAKDGGNYTLDRKTGDLTVVVASSTGGYFLYDHCSPEK